MVAFLASVKLLVVRHTQDGRAVCAIALARLGLGMAQLKKIRASVRMLSGFFGKKTAWPGAACIPHSGASDSSIQGGESGGNKLLRNKKARCQRPLGQLINFTHGCFNLSSHCTVPASSRHPTQQENLGAPAGRLAVTRPCYAMLLHASWGICHSAYLLDNRRVDKLLVISHIDTAVADPCHPMHAPLQEKNGPDAAQTDSARTVARLRHRTAWG